MMRVLVVDMRREPFGHRAAARPSRRVHNEVFA